MELPKALFITGTDTDCGKTYAACAIMCAYKALGYKVVGFKPVASGSTYVDGALVNEDVELLIEHANVELPANIINPYIFEPPISPHFAARQSGQRIEPQHIEMAFRHCQEAADIVVVEGAGGWRVPLDEGFDIAALSKQLNIPVVVVCGLRLGCINHTLLTINDIRRSDVPIFAWVANQISATYEYVDDTIATIQSAVSVPLLAKLEYSKVADAASAAQKFDLAQAAASTEQI